MTKGGLSLKVSIFTCTMREDFMNNEFENYKRQKYDDKELIIALTKSNGSNKVAGKGKYL
jgi:hypothetical protein